MASTVNYRIEPLNRNNYDTWKLQAQAILIKSDLWKYVNGEEECPNDSKTEEKKIWMKQDLTARSDLTLIISPGELRNIKNCTTSKDVWNTLNSIYASKGPARKATLLKKLILNKMKDGDNVRNHLNEFTDTIDKLFQLDIVINDDLLSIMMLYSLSPSFENFRVAIESRDTLPKPDQLKIKILEECEARSKNVTSNSEDAFFSKHFKNNYKKNVVNHSEPKLNNYKPNSNRVYCKKCGRNNHSTDKCWAKTKVNESSYKVEEFCLSSEKFKSETNLWCLDSGSTSHMCKNKDVFTEVLHSSPGQSLRLASEKHTTLIEGKGDVKVFKNNSVVNLLDTLYVPDLTSNLLSVNKITEKGFTVIFDQNKALVTNSENEVTLKATKRNGLYLVEFDNVEKANLVTNNKINEWHTKLGHINEKDLKHALKNKTIDGLNFNSNETLGECEVCIQSKMTKLPFPKQNSPKDLDFLEIVHSDVCGPMKTKSPGGARYFVTFIDEKSRFCKIYFLKQKNEVLKYFKIYKNEVENFKNKKIKFLQTDNGKGEYCNDMFDKYLQDNGIQRRLSTPYTPEQNGLAERLNRTLLDKARCLMVESKIASMFWAEAVNTANYLRNRCPSRSIDHRTPFELWIGRIPSVRHLNVFGSKAYVLNKKQSINGKFSPRAEEGIFVGYSEVSKAYRIWIHKYQNVITTRDVRVLQTFSNSNTKFEYDLLDEEENRNSEKHDKMQIQRLTTVGTTLENREITPIMYENQEPNDNSITTQQLENPILDSETSEEYIVNEDDDDGSCTIAPDISQRPHRHKQPPKWLNAYETEFSALGIGDTDKVNDLSYWHEAIKEEIKSHLKNNTWSIINKTEDMNTIDCKLVLKEKYKSDGTLERKKARLVARGFSQQPNVDYNETFAPVVKLSSIRLLLGIAVERDMKLNQLDVSTAFLNGDLKENIYMQVPPDLESYLEEIIAENESNKELKTQANIMLKDLRQTPKEKRICHLNKALYGLKQAGRQWFYKLNTKLKDLGFHASLADPCMYVSDTKTEIIAIYVDDLIIASKDEKSFQKIKNELMKSFEMRDLGQLNHCLGINFHYKDGKLIANQSKYIQDILNKFKMIDCKPIGTPMDPKIKLEKITTISKPVNLPYQNLIGSLMFLAVATRPDIAYAVSYLSQFNTNFSEEHWKAAKRVLRYLQGTKEKSLVFEKTNKPLIGLTDADWGSSIMDRKSISGYCFMYANGTVSWASRKQKCISLSTAEAEYCAITEATKEALHLRQLLNDLGQYHEKITILNDNQAAQHIASNPVVSAKSKHIDIKLHFIREKIEHGLIELKYLPTELMTADVLTKALSKPRFENLIKKLGLI